MPPSLFLPPCPLPSLRPAFQFQHPHRNSPVCCAETSPFEALFLKGPVPGDRLVRTISSNGHVSCRAITCTGLVSGATLLHRTSPVASTAFGRALVCGLLLSSGKKDGESLQLEFRGNGPIKGITVISNGAGEVRGYVGNPYVDMPLKNGSLDVGGAVGKGLLAVVRSSKWSKTPYTGLTVLETGEVAEDVAKYLADSEQTPSVVGAGVYLKGGGKINAAGGFLLQMLPGASEESLEIVERNVERIGKPSELVRSGWTLERIVEELMRDLAPMKLASVSPRYSCKCGIERVKRTVRLLPEEDVRELLQQQGKIEGRFTNDRSSQG